MSTTRNVQIVPPAELTGLQLSSPKDRAAGFKAIGVAVQHIAEETNLWKGFKVLNKLNQRDGFDCPGCAWPEPAHRSKLGEYCENGAKAVAEEITDKHCDIDFFLENSIEEISRWSDYKIGKSGRVVHPMYLPKGKSHYEPISWDHAFELIAEELRACATPDEAVFYTSGRTSNEAAFLYQLFVRMYGTNNLPDCSNMCHESSGVGLSETIGIGKGTVTLEDIYNAEVILVIGQNPGTNHPRMLSALQKCKKNGGIVVHVNPLPESGTTRFVDPQSPVEVLMGGTKIADHFLQVRIGGDLALLKYILKKMVLADDQQHNIIDKKFIEANTLGYTDFIKNIRAVDEAEMLRECGVSADAIAPVIKLLCEKKKIISCWAMGVTQQKHAVPTIQEIVNLHLLRGAVGIPGAGLCPVRGHSNVQGDRTMGIYEKPKEAFLAKMDKHFGITSPRKEGYDVVEAIHAMDQNKVRVFIAMGGNFISATPESELTGKAMQKVGLTVQVSTKLNRAHVVTGEHALILPCLGRTEKDMQHGVEQFVTVENSMGVVSMSRGNLTPASHQLLSEPMIAARMGEAYFGKNHKIAWMDMGNNYDLIRENIQGAIAGFDDYNKRVRQPDGFELPNGPRHGKFTTASTLAHFTVNTLPNLRIAEGNYIMMTIRSHDQYNTTIYGLNDRYRGITNERRVVLMNKEDMRKAGLTNKQLVNLECNTGGLKRVAEKFHVIEFDIPKGCTATYFPETNCLVPLQSVADRSNTPMSKFVEISIHPE